MSALLRSHPGRTSSLAAALVALALLLSASLAAAKPTHKQAAQPTPAQAKQIAKLEALTGTLARELADLEARSSALAAKAATAPPTPATLPFQGPAGGALVGAFPDPRLAPGTVGTAELLPGAVTSAAIRNGSLTGADIPDGELAPPAIGPGQVYRGLIPPFTGGALEMGTVLEYPVPGDATGQHTFDPGDSSVTIKLACPAGTHLLTGGWEWSDENGDGTTMFASHPAEDGEGGVEYADTTWEWRAKVLVTGTTNTFKPKLLCLLD
jgi:hypothetical protein